MQLFFQNSAWAWLALFAVIPLLVHLVARARPQVYRYPSLRFLREVVRKSARWQKPQDWLVWFLRTLVLLGLILAILGPLLMKSGNAPGARKIVVVVIDRSASMAYEDRFGEASSQALLALREQNPDFANLIWIDSSPKAFYREPGPAVGGLLEAIERAEVTAESGSPQAALSLAATQLAEIEGERELIVISDFQKSAWEDLAWPISKEVTVTRVQVGEGEGTNHALKSLFTEPAQPVVGQAASLICQVRNYSAEPVRIPVYANIEGARSSREVEVAAWGEAEVIFPLSFVDAGRKLIQVRLGGDAFPNDDWRAMELSVRENLILAAEGKTSVWPAVAEALPWLTIQAEGGDAQEADFLWYAQWTGQESEELSKRKEGGPTLLLQMAQGLSSGDVESLGGKAAGDSNSFEEERLEGGWPVRIGKEEAPVFELFRDGEYGNPFEGTFQRRLKVEAQGETWASYADGVPALQFLVEEGAGSPVLLWNLPLSSPDSDWAQQPNFIPFLGELLLNTRPRVILGSELTVSAGSLLQWSPGLEGDGGSVVLVSDAEEEMKVLRKKSEGAVYYESEEGTSPGVWRWKSGGREVARKVVNFPAEESDLRLMADGDSGELRTADSFQRQLALSTGWAIWPWLVFAALLFLIMESALALWRPKNSNKEVRKGGALS